MPGSEFLRSRLVRLKYEHLNRRVASTQISSLPLDRSVKLLIAHVVGKACWMVGTTILETDELSDEA